MHDSPQCPFHSEDPSSLALGGGRHAAVLLGAGPVPPIEMAQICQTMAAGGYRAPLGAIQEVVLPRGDALQRYPLRLECAVRANAAYLVDAALHEVSPARRRSPCVTCCLLAW